MIRFCFGGLLAACSLSLAAATPGVTVTVEISGVRAASGQVLVALCGDASAPFPGACITHAARVAAQEGTVRVAIDGVAPGRYAVQAFHDENGNGRPEIPPEGFGFGNDAPFPPTFDGAAVKVDGPTAARLAMSYIGGSPAPGTSSTAALALAPLPAGVTRFAVREQGLFGELFAPQGAQRRPGLLLISGSDGGLDTMSQMAPAFAAQGYAVLALAYWRAPGLPETLENIPLEYFDRALAWLAARPEVAGAPLGVLGWSRGAEAALLIGSRNPRVRALVAVSPSGAVWQGLSFQQRRNEPAWTAGGRPLPSLQPAGELRLDSLTTAFVAAIPEMDRRPDTAIAVENTRGGILLISGGADNVWPATRFADRIMARLQAKSFKGTFTQLDYPQAGHAVFMGAPDGALARAMSAPNPMLGGTPAANAAAWRDNWPKTLAFLREQLGSTR